MNIKTMSKEELKDYINSRLEAGDILKDISEEHGVNRNYISRKLKDYTLDRETKLYKLREIEVIDGQVTTEELQRNYQEHQEEKATTKQLLNDYQEDTLQEEKETTKQLPSNYQVTGELQLDKSKINDLIELVEAKKDIISMIEWYRLNNTVIEDNELKIDLKEFTGDLQPRSYKLYENVREALKDFTEKHKEYKAQDIVNKAIMEFITRYK